MTHLVNPNLQFLWDSWNDNKVGVVQEGSSRSGKTWANIDFLIWLCSNVETKATINIIKETYKSFKTTLYDDFNRRLPMYGLSSPFADKQDVNQFYLFGNKINLLGADNPSVYAGVGSDYFWVNEALDVAMEVFNQSEQRCRKFWWMDYNPKEIEHWVYDRVCNRGDVGFIKTTFLDNLNWISEPEKRKLLSYESTHPDDRDKPVKQRRPHPTNISEGTADDYYWNVYGLGLRSAPEGLVFQYVNWIPEFPKAENVYYALDFGTVDPAALVRGCKKDKDSYFEKIWYGAVESPDKYEGIFQDAGLTKSTAIWCDSADQGTIGYLRRKGWRVLAVNKPAGSIAYGISLLKERRLNIVDCKEWRAEQAGYRKRVVNGITLNEPADRNNHLWDAARYLAMTNFV